LFGALCVFQHQQLATRVDGELYYILGDHLGSTTVVADDQGNEVGHVLYDPYGEVLQSTLPAGISDRLFTGQRWERGFGLSDYNARYYDPYLNRFISPDSIVPDPTKALGLNRYAYANNSPLKYTDPSGHLTDEQIEEWTGHKIKDLSEDQLEFLRTLLLGDYMTFPRDDRNSVNSSGNPFDIELQRGRLVFRSSEGSSYTLDEMANKGFLELNYATVLRGTGPSHVVYQNGHAVSGWEREVASSKNTVTQLSRWGLVGGAAVGGTLAGAGLGCAATLGSCAAAPEVGLATGIVAGVGVGIATDPALGKPGVQEGDTLYSYRFANGESYTTVVNENGDYTGQAPTFVEGGNKLFFEQAWWALTTQVTR
jgi:RHS repeat-associated protein